MSRPSTIVISDWLMNFRSNQWTPFEAATALKAALEKEGYVIVGKSNHSRIDTDSDFSPRGNVERNR